MTRKRYLRLILILGSLTALGPFSIDMYLPGFPAMAKDLNTDVASIGLSTFNYFIEFHWDSCCMVRYFDRYGRKNHYASG